MSAEDIKTRVDGMVLEVIIDRPKANAIDRATSRRMGEPREPREPRSCEACGSSGHAPRASYCADCGAKLPKA